MYFNKYPYRSNFEYPNTGVKKASEEEVNLQFEVTDFQPNAENPHQKMDVELGLTKYEGDIYYIQYNSKKWPKNYAQSELSLPKQINLAEGMTSCDVK